MAEGVRIRSEILEEMLLHARREREMECCGLLGGRDGVITAIFPAQNALASPTAFEIAPQELFQVFRTIRAEGLEHLGIYHSHLKGDNVPSPRDVQQSYYPEQAHFVLSPLGDAANPIRAFLIRDGRAQEIQIETVDAPGSREAGSQ